MRKEYDFTAARKNPYLSLIHISIDLGVNRSGVEASVPQDVGDLFQSRSTLKHGCGRSVA